MSRRLAQLIVLTFLILVFVSPLPSFGQVEVSVEARVLGISASGLHELGLVLPESAPGIPGSPMGFAVVLPEGEAKALVDDSRARTVHSLKLQGAPGNALRFRVETRAQANPNSPAIYPPYFEVGIAFEVTPTVYPNRNIALSTTSVLQIRRGGDPAAGLAAVVFETPQIKRDIQIPEGKTILLGGFLTASNSSGMPVVPMIAGNPILGYLLSKSPRKGDDPEIVVLLTPTVSGVTEAPVRTTSVTPAPPEQVTKSDGPLVGSAAVLLSNSTPKPDLSATKPPAIVNLPPITSPAISFPPLSAPAPVPGPGPAVVTVPAPAPAATPKQVPLPEVRFYSLQVGAFGSTANAEALVFQLRKMFDGVFVDKAASGSTPYRVRVGRLSGFGAAKQLQLKLMDAGFDSFIVPPDSQ